MKRDVWLGTLGAVALVAGLAALFAVEGGPGAGGGRSLRFDVTWTVAVENGPQASGTLREGASDAAALDVARGGLASLEFALVWRDDVGAADRFRLAVTSPAGETRTAEGANGEGAQGLVVVAFDGLNPVPAVRTAAADSEAAARERAIAGAGVRGQGTWRAVVELLEAGDQSAPVPGLPPLAEDTGQAWQLKTVLRAHEPRLARV